MGTHSPLPPLPPPSSPSFDPGLTQQYTGPLLRAINKDGSFNIRRRGFSGIAGSFYFHLVNMTWPRFLALVLAAYLAVNTAFATIYYLLGRDVLHAAEGDLALTPFQLAFFFSLTFAVGAVEAS